MLRITKILALSLFFLALAAPGCTKKSGAPSSEQASSSGGEEKVVNVATWSNYLSPQLLAEFEKRSGIRVQVSNYSSNEELLAKLQAGASGYDVVVPSDYMVFAMTKLGLLRDLDYSLLPNAKSIDSQYLKKSFDPTNRVSLPYDWGTTGIAVNRDLYKGKIEGWKDLFTIPALAGKFSLLDDVRETIGAALKAQGFSLNSKNPDELQKAKALLLQARPRVKAFTSEPLMPLVNSETAVAHSFSTDALQARQQTGGKIIYLVPVEGGTFWIDNLVVPTGAAHVKAAHTFINFLLEGKSSISTVLSIWVAPTNKDALPLLPPDVRANRMLFPLPAVMSKCEMIEDLGDALSLWDRIWTEVKAQRG